MSKNILVFFTLIIFSSITKAQDLNFQVLNDSIQSLFGSRDFHSAKILNDKLVSFKDSDESNYWVNKNYFIYYYKNKNLDSCSYYIKQINTDKLSNQNLNNYYYDLAYLFKSKNQLDSSALYFNKSLRYFEKDTSQYSAYRARIYAGLYSIYRQISDNQRHLHFLKKYLKESKKSDNSYYIATAYNNLALYYQEEDNTKVALNYFQKALNKFQDGATKNRVYQNIGTLYLDAFKNQDSALYYFNKAKNNNSSNRTLAHIDYYISKIHKSKSSHLEENILLINALRLIKTDPYEPLERDIYLALADNYQVQNDFKNAFKYYSEYHNINETIKEKSIVEKIEDIQTKYDTEKKEKENLLLKTNIEKEQQQKRGLLIGSLIILLFGSITAFLIQKNTRKKQKLAEQEKTLETQKLATVLKEQELKSIDAMIEGQEKERQRIANDLHDDLGGLMATVKLHFNVLKDKQTPELFDKTNNLLDEAYNKIRGIAHAKNSGVIAKQGLLKAVQNMANKISVSNKITVDVIDHGLENRLKNSLELTIFRIIQELITNVIKHADATEAIIHLTNHEDTLNIMIEDNGKGFNVRQITTKNKGMGISSIDKRVEHLNGNMTIESERNKGTTIIIDIPT
ncbi:ATP-binding protein [uncultured Algibacter sp.]|uniref:ATP-binding protein n=1 Tax=uncultured Algibacter sp. TaxID=298659 RepID=UPI002607BDC5|nr:ATP-binding protein [uncultured Algibacter sp.]